MIKFLHEWDDLSDGPKVFVGVMVFLWSFFLFIFIPYAGTYTVDSLAGQSQSTCTEVSK